MTVPYAPPALSIPVVNPSIGGFGRPVPYISPSKWKNWPTGLDVSGIVVDDMDDPADAAAQLQALANWIVTACARCDRYTMGADPSAKGASLCATSSVEQARVKILQGEARLICAYRPVLEITGLALGIDPSNVQGIDPNTAAAIRVEGQVLHVPGYAMGTSGVSTTFGSRFPRWGGQTYFVWSYVNGYPHTYLTATAAKNATSITVFPTGPGSTVLGIYEGTQLDIEDGENTETVMVTATPTSNVLAVTALAAAHTVPSWPDFLPVTALPFDVRAAAIYMTNYLIKERGASGFDIAEDTAPGIHADAGRDADEDLATALDFLEEFRVVSKVKV